MSALGQIPLIDWRGKEEGKQALVEGGGERIGAMEAMDGGGRGGSKMEYLEEIEVHSVGYSLVRVVEELF